MDFFNKNKTLIFRIVGSLMLLIGFVIHFWSVPQEGLTKSDIAAANVARMEASVRGGSAQDSSAQDNSKFLKEYKHTQEKQMQYLTIIAMIFGVGFLGYSFIKRD